MTNLVEIFLLSFDENIFLGKKHLHWLLVKILQIVPELKYLQCAGWHKKKTVITKSRITSKILFRLRENFSYSRSSLCSRHLQSFKSVLQKLFVSLALKKCAPNELPDTVGTFGSGGQSSRWPSHIPPLGSLLLLPSCQGLSLHNRLCTVIRT